MTPLEILSQEISAGT